MGKNRKQRIIVWLVVVFGVFLFVLINENVFANEDGVIDVTGGGTGGDTTDCNFPQGFQNICKYGNDTYEGGASWHLYKVGDSVKPNNDVTASNGILKDDPNDPTDDIPTEASIKNECNSKMSNWNGWYAAYGWDGRLNGRGSGYVHWGPAQWNTGVIAGAYYNSHGGITAETFKERAANGTLASGTKLYGTTSSKNGQAEILHGGAIPAKTGAFCVSGTYFDPFSGLSRVSEGTAAYKNVADDKKASTGWKQSDKTVFHVMSCDNANGCSAKISHYLQRSAGNRNAEYTLSRLTNIKKLEMNSVSGVEDFSGTDNGKGKKVSSTNFTNVMPGEYVCETLTFNIDFEGHQASTAACIYMQGTVGSEIGIDVNNTTLSSGWVKSVYAKPGDNISLKGWYKPSYQYTKNFNAIKTTVGSCVKGKGLILSSFNRCVDPDWNNAFSIGLNNVSFETEAAWGTLGVSNKYEKTSSKQYKIISGDVGKKIEAKAATNTSGIATSPKEVKIDIDDKKKLTATVDKGAISASAFITVPYNYVNTTSIAASDDAVVYAGESTKVSFSVTVGTKWNSLTKGTYATIVPNGKWKLEVCNERGTQCKETDAGSGKLNENSNLNGDSFSKDLTVNVPDWPAGTKICIRPAVYPANSGNDDNYTNENGSNTWQYSNERACYKVAKKPNFQVWGGNIYSAKKIITSVAGKTNLDGYVDYDASTNNSSKRYVFGSWGELGVIATGKVKGLASGAGTGYSGAGRLADPGGSEEAKMSYCNRTTLSFANVDCDKADAYTGGIMSGNAMGTAISDKKDILENLIEGNDTVNVTDSYVDLSVDDEEKLTDKGIYHYNSGASDLEISEAEISYGKKIVVHSEGNITISGDLKHYGYGEYSSLNNVSRLIIYGKNIKINCGVLRVDALLVADEEVNTCVDNDGNTPDVNSGLRSKQLLINGAVIAGKVRMNRTYGAATGKYSIEPAEIINFDATLYLWGTRKSSITETGKISTISIKELSPRY